MTSTPLNNTWEWKPLLVECPACRIAVAPESAGGHADWHWLTNTETERLEPHE